MKKYGEYKAFNERVCLVKERLDDFDLPYNEQQVIDLVKKFWSVGCCDEQNINECVLQHQYNIS